MKVRSLLMLDKLHIKLKSTVTNYQHLRFSHDNKLHVSLRYEPEFYQLDQPFLFMLHQNDQTIVYYE